MFRGKQGGKRYQGNLTKIGSREFETMRRRAQILFHAVTGFEVKASDADTIEFLARGEADAKDYWERMA